MISVMPCTAKKAEASRPEFSREGKKDVDIVITTQELSMMIREAGIVFSELEGESLDMPFGLASGAGVIFGVTGGVAEAVLRKCFNEKTADALKEISFTGIRGMEGLKEASVNIDGRDIRIAVVHGLKNAEELVKLIKSGEKSYDFVEVMACPGGCIAGGGQPVPVTSSVSKRGQKASIGLTRCHK
jgi:NADH-quinone oxidoreductase subunit G